MLCLFNYPAWNTHCDRVRWYIAVHKAACTYRYIVTDGDTGKNRNTGTNPHVVTYGYRAGILKAFIALFNINRMPSCGKTAVGSNENIIAKDYRGCIEYNKVVVRIEILPKRNIATIVAPK